MSEPTPPRWPALAGLRSLDLDDLALLLAALLAPLTLLVGALRRKGWRAVGCEPDPTSLPERLIATFRAEHPDAGVPTIAVLSCASSFALLLGATCNAAGGCL